MKLINIFTAIVLILTINSCALISKPNKIYINDITQQNYILKNYFYDLYKLKINDFIEIDNIYYITEPENNTIYYCVNFKHNENPYQNSTFLKTYWNYNANKIPFNNLYVKKNFNDSSYVIQQYTMPDTKWSAHPNY